MIQVNVQEAKTHLSRLLAEVERGEEVILSRNGVPIARLEAVHRESSRPLGFVSGDLPASFFDELPDDELRAWDSR